MPYYETVYIARQDVSAAQVETMTKAIVSIIEESKGNVVKNEYWGLKSLAYKIKKNRKGHYVELRFEAPAETVDKLDYHLRYHDDVLRYLTVRVEELEEAEAPKKPRKKAA